MISDYLGDRHFWRDALRLGLPIALQNLLVSSFTLVDTLMVGQLGDIPLSAVGMAGQWSWMLNMMLFGLFSGTAVFVSQYWGVHDRDGIRRTYGISLVFSLLISAIFTVAALTAPVFIIRIFNRNPGVVEAGASYLSIAAWSYPAIALTGVAGAVLRSTENVRLPMYASAISTVFNAVFNYGLIFGRLGMPCLGVRGAAYATVISAWAGAILVYLISLIRKSIIIAPPRSVFSFSFKAIGIFLRRTLPVVLNESCWGAGTLIFNIIFANIGYENFAAVTILRTFENIAFVFFIGLCNACSIMVGKAVGSGRIRDAIRDAKRFSLLIPLLGVVLGALIVIFRFDLVRIFDLSGALSEKTIKTAAMIMLVYGLELPVRNIPYIQIVGIYRAAGDTAKGAFYDLICLWGMSLPATLIAAYLLRWDFVIVFAIMYVFEDYLKSFLCLRHLRSGKWLKPVTDEGRAALREYRLTEAADALK